MGELALFVTGLFVGSFANATAWRVRARRRAAMAMASVDSGEAGWRTSGERGSIWLSRSACACCGHELAARDLVPLLSWLFLRGACRYCREPISLRYPLSELLTGLGFWLAYAAL